MQEKTKKAIRAEVKGIIQAVIIALIIRAFLVSAYAIPSGSMESTMLVGDHLFADKITYGLKIPLTDVKVFKGREIKRGEIVIFDAPPPVEKNPLIKRCIGLPGDIVEIKNKEVYINNKKLEEPYKEHCDANIMEGRDNFGPIKVPDKCYFMMGDNRDFSFDSRYWGFVKEEKIVGRPLLIYWPMNRLRLM